MVVLEAGVIRLRAMSVRMTALSGKRRGERIEMVVGEEVAPPTGRAEIRLSVSFHVAIGGGKQCQRTGRSKECGHGWRVSTAFRQQTKWPTRSNTKYAYYRSPKAT